MEERLIFESENEKNTIDLGKRIAELVKSGQIILLKGELGTGKTRLVQGIASRLKIENQVTSPTYNLINEYRGKLSLYHMDLYRIDDEFELYNIGFEDYLYRDGIIVIEWPEIALNLIPDDFLLLEFKVIANKKRKIKISGVGVQSEKILKGLSQDENIRN